MFITYNLTCNNNVLTSKTKHGSYVEFKCANTYAVFLYKIFVGTVNFD